MPFIRLAIVCFLLAVFAYGFSTLVDHAEDTRNTQNACAASGDPGCTRLTRQ